MKKTFLTITLALVCAFSFAQVGNTQQPSIQLIRHATLVLNYNGQKILIDPMLSPKGAFGSIRGERQTPLVDLIIPIEDITKNLDLVLVTHTHIDHFDDAAKKALGKSIPLFNQPADKEYFKGTDFRNTTTVDNSIVWNGITITRTYAQHGTGKVLEQMEDASGFVFAAPGQPTIYLVGDAVWTEEIYQNIKKYQPDYIVVNSGGALMPNFDATPIIMDADQTMSLIQESGKAKVIGVHMDAVDHCLTTREVLKKKAKEYNIGSDKLLIPNDGETINL